MYSLVAVASTFKATCLALNNFLKLVLLSRCINLFILFIVFIINMVKHNEVITNEQVGYQRHWASKVTETEAKWKKLNHWYAEEQWKGYTQLARIYVESIVKYGEEEFMKYAKTHRLRRHFTDKVDGPRREKYANLWCYPMDYMDDVKLSATTNGTYGMIPPGYHHYYC